MSKPESSPKRPPAPASRISTIERDHFILHAPFAWEPVAGNNPLEFEFRNQKLREQIIVSILLAKSPIDLARRKDLVEELGKFRLKAISDLSKGRAVHRPLEMRSGMDQAEARGFAVDRSLRIRCAFVIRAAAAQVVTVALTRYFLEDIGTPFEVYAGLIFDLFQMKNPGVMA